MKHTKRMVLIPEDALHRYEQRQRLDTSPITSNMMQKDTVMSNVLQRSHMDDDEKQKLRVCKFGKVSKPEASYPR